MQNQTKLMVVTAHPGDWVIRTGGTIAKYVQAGHEVRALALTWGQYSESRTRWDEDPARTVDEVIAIRKEEAEEAAQILGVDQRVMGWEDGQLVLPQDRIEAIRHEIGLFGPNVILTHPPTDHNHPDHVTTSEAVKLARRYIGARRQGDYSPLTSRIGLYYIEPTAPSPSYARFYPDVYIDITDVFETKMKAVAVINRTQPTVTDYYGDMARMRGREASAWVRKPGKRVVHAEGFAQDTPCTLDWLP